MQRLCNSYKIDRRRCDSTVFGRSHTKFDIGTRGCRFDLLGARIGRDYTLKMLREGLCCLTIAGRTIPREIMLRTIVDKKTV